MFNKPPEFGDQRGLTGMLDQPAGRSLCPTLYVLFPRKSQGWGIKGIDGEYLGKPSHPEAVPRKATSLHVDWLPARFVHTEAYPRP